MNNSDKNECATLPISKQCFVCGVDNHAGLKAEFFAEGEITKAVWQPQSHHCGYENVVHGGVTAAILDECMGWAAARSIGRMCVTGELTVRYIQRVPNDRELMAIAQTIKSSRLLARVQATLEDGCGTVFAKAEGKFVPVSVEETLNVDDAMLYRGGELRVFDHLRKPDASS